MESNGSEGAWPQRADFGASLKKSRQANTRITQQLTTIVGLTTICG